MTPCAVSPTNQGGLTPTSPCRASKSARGQRNVRIQSHARGSRLKGRSTAGPRRSAGCDRMVRRRYRTRWISALSVAEIVLAKERPINESPGIRSMAKSWRAPRVSWSAPQGDRESCGGVPDELQSQRPTDTERHPDGVGSGIKSGLSADRRQSQLRANSGHSSNRLFDAESVARSQLQTVGVRGAVRKAPLTTSGFRSIASDC